MNALLHQIIQRCVDEPMSLQWQLAGEIRADDANVEVAFPLVRMAGVLVTLVQHLQLAGRQRLGQALVDLINHALAHAGSALRKGLICTSA